MPDQDSEHLSPATRLLEKRREMAEVEQALGTQKEVGKGRRKHPLKVRSTGVSNENGDIATKEG